MDTVKNNGLTDKLYWQEEKVPIDDGSNQKLDQEDFFKLLTEQLANQDPTKPVDNDQMVAQMTSFNMAEGIQGLNDKFEAFATSMTSNQALQASSLIGQKVLVQGNVGHIAKAGDEVTGVVISDKTVQDMEIQIKNEKGETLKTMKVGTQAAGNIEFTWDGTDNDGKALPPGNYAVIAQGHVDGKETQLPTAVNRHVDSVSLAGSGRGVVLNLDGDVSIKLDDVIQIGA